MSLQPVTADWMVDEILTVWPQTMTIFLKRRMNCVGCCMAAFERLGDALQIYGEAEDVFLAELNQVVLMGAASAAQDHPGRSEAGPDKVG